MRSLTRPIFLLVLSACAGLGIQELMHRSASSLAEEKAAPASNLEEFARSRLRWTDTPLAAPRTQRLPATDPLTPEQEAQLLLTIPTPQEQPAPPTPVAPDTARMGAEPALPPLTMPHNRQPAPPTPAPSANPGDPYYNASIGNNYTVQVRPEEAPPALTPLEPAPILPTSTITPPRNMLPPPASSSQKSVLTPGRPATKMSNSPPPFSPPPLPSEPLQAAPRTPRAIAPPVAQPTPRDIEHALEKSPPSAPTWEPAQEPPRYDPEYQPRYYLESEFVQPAPAPSPYRTPSYRSSNDYPDPKELVHRRAAAKAAERQRRLEARRWAGQSPLRPNVQATPFMAPSQAPTIIIAPR